MPLSLLEVGMQVHWHRLGAESWERMVVLV